MKLVLAAAWILIGAAVTAAVYWGFLITPESTVWALMVSAVLAVVVLALAGFTIAGAIAVWWHGASSRAVQIAARSIPGIVPAALIVALIWWLVHRAEIWIAMRSGQINAWFIARFGWDDMSWLFTAIGVAAGWLRWVIAALLAVSLMAAFAAAGWRALAQGSWLRRALGARAIAASTLWFGVLVALPWLYLLPWRPRNLPPTSIEFAFIAAKLTTAAILFALGTALIVREAAAEVPDPEIAQNA